MIKVEKRTVVTVKGLDEDILFSITTEPPNDTVSVRSSERKEVAFTISIGDLKEAIDALMSGNVTPVVPEVSANKIEEQMLGHGAGSIMHNFEQG